MLKSHIRISHGLSPLELLRKIRDWGIHPCLVERIDSPQLKILINSHLIWTVWMVFRPYWSRPYWLCWLPSGCYIAIEEMAPVEIVDVPISLMVDLSQRFFVSRFHPDKIHSNSGGIFHSGDAQPQDLCPLAMLRGFIGDDSWRTATPGKSWVKHGWKVMKPAEDLYMNLCDLGTSCFSMNFLVI